MPETVNNLSENASTHILDTVSSREEQNSLLLIVKLYNDLNIHSKHLMIDTKEIYFSYCLEKNDFSCNFKAKSLKEFMYKMVSFYNQLVQRNRGYVVNVPFNDTDKQGLCLIYQFFLQYNVNYKRLHSQGNDWSFSYQVKKGQQRKSIYCSPLNTFFIAFIDTYFNLLSTLKN